MSRVRTASRGSILLGVVIVAVFAAVIANVPEAVKHSHWRKEDKRAYTAWVADHGGRRAYGMAVTETHSRYDVVCAPHFPNVERRGRRDADYRLYLLVDSHGSGAHVVRAAHGPLKVKPTASGPKCGAPPP